MGQSITGFHLNRQGREDPHSLTGLDLSLQVGQDYLNDMTWAVKYATENRLMMINRIADLVEPRFGIWLKSQTYVDCPHNFARLERIGGIDLLVHRKSANSARLDELGIIAGTMASGSRIVRGLGNDMALNSSSHGAGRLMSRTKAAQTIKARELQKQMDGVVFDRDQAAALRDEAPQAYRDLNKVMQGQKDLVKTVAILTPILNDKRT